MPFDSSTAHLVNSQQSQQGGFDSSTAQLVNQSQSSNSDNGDSDLSTIQPLPDSLNNNAQVPQQQKQPSPINFQDMLKMAALNSPQEQQDYLKSKFKFAEPVTDQNGKFTGNFNVGDDPTNLNPIHPGTIGDAALNVLSKGAAMIPAIAGQMQGATMGAEIGSAGGPVGTIIGGLVGAGAGAALGEGAKNLASSANKGYDPQKAATDNVISGLFGAGGQALGEVVKFGAQNYMAPKIAAAIDGAIKNGTNHPAGAAFLSKILKFTANVDTKESMMGSQIGWKNIYDNHANLDPDEIDNIAQDVTKAYNQKEGIAKAAYDKAEESFANDNPEAQVKTSDMLEKMTDQMGNSGLQILNKAESSLDDMSSSFQFREDIPHDVKSALPDVKTFFTRLGAISTNGGKTFHIPDNANTSLSGAMGAKKLFAKTFNNPNFNEGVGNIMKQGLYGEGPSTLYPKGMAGLRGAINDTAMATGHDSYIIANNNFSNLMKAGEGELRNLSGNKFNLNGWMDISNPSSVANYLKKINKLDAFGNQAIENLSQQIGGDFKDRASQWAVAQAMAKASPQILRLSVVGGLLGLALPGSPAEKVARVPMAFALGSPTGVKVMARTAESGGALASVGSKILQSFVKTAQTPAGVAVLSQLLSKKVRR